MITTKGAIGCIRSFYRTQPCSGAPRRRRRRPCSAAWAASGAFIQKGRASCVRGERTAKLGIVLSGRVLIQSGDLWGNTTVLDNVLPGQIFAETYACTGEVLLVDAAAAEDTTVLFLDVSRVLQLCPDACAHHRRLVANLLHLSAQKNLNLSRKILHTSAKSIRGAAAVLFFRPFPALRQPRFHHPLQPPAAGGLPQCGPQRPVPRTEQNAEGGPAAHRAQPRHAVARRSFLTRPLPFSRPAGPASAGAAVFLFLSGRRLYFPTKYPPLNVYTGLKKEDKP